MRFQFEKFNAIGDIGESGVGDIVFLFREEGFIASSFVQSQKSDDNSNICLCCFTVLFLWKNVPIIQKHRSRLFSYSVLLIAHVKVNNFDCT